MKLSVTKFFKHLFQLAINQYVLKNVKKSTKQIFYFQYPPDTPVNIILTNSIDQILYIDNVNFATLMGQCFSG